MLRSDPYFLFPFFYLIILFLYLISFVTYFELDMRSISIYGYFDMRSTPPQQCCASLYSSDSHRLILAAQCAAPGLLVTHDDLAL
jgi:hypothetical protein